MRVVVWLGEETWLACALAARDIPATEVRLLHVIDPGWIEAVAGPRDGLLGRGAVAADNLESALADAEAQLFRAAEAALGRPAAREPRRGDMEREVIAACADADLLICARDGDHSRLGPRSIGRQTRFVVDHAPCRVLLVWPDEPPPISTLPPPPPPPRGE